jgi:hypothetical protein
MDVSESIKTDVKTANGMIVPGTFRVIAGPCTVESYEQFLAGAKAVKQAGFEYVRGGAFKPRTSPYSFQGLGEEGLKIMAEVATSLGLKVVTEVMDPYDIELVMEHAQVLQIGARNAANFSLLKRVGAAIADVDEQPVVQLCELMALPPPNEPDAAHAEDGGACPASIVDRADGASSWPLPGHLRRSGSRPPAPGAPEAGVSLSWNAVPSGMGTGSG